MIDIILQPAKNLIFYQFLKGGDPSDLRPQDNKATQWCHSER
jgi:hypothetical protein